MLKSSSLALFMAANYLSLPLTKPGIEFAPRATILGRSIKQKRSKSAVENATLSGHEFATLFAQKRVDPF